MSEDRIPKKMLHTKKGGKTTTNKWIDQIRNDIEMRGGLLEEIQEYSNWENRDGWRFLCNSRPISLENI